jgi:hypothetical protein
MGKEGVTIFSRRLGHRNGWFKLAHGTEFTFLSGEEKGIDVRLAPWDRKGREGARP